MKPFFKTRHSIRREYVSMKIATTFHKASLAALVAAGVSLFAGSAAAQMSEKPYSFQARDRAGLAVYMKNLEESRNNNSSDSTTAAATYLVCGGGSGGSTSTANSSCIIINNSDAALGIGQDSAGSQDSNSNVETTSTTTTADQVSNILNAK
jgi:hypothetical protein